MIPLSVLDLVPVCEGGTVGQAMVAAAQTAPDRNKVYSYSEMKALISQTA